MAEHWLSRGEGLLGITGIEKLKKAKVAVFGIGGVGGYAAEGLARCGVGALELVDSDVVSVTNINRQIIATTKTLGEYKTTLMAQRIKEIIRNRFKTIPTLQESQQIVIAIGK